MQGKGTPVYWSETYEYDMLDHLVTAQRGSVTNWSTTPTMPTSSPTPYVWDWSEEDVAGLMGLDKLGNWNYFLYGEYGNLSTDDRSHNTVNEVAGRTCANRQTPGWNAAGNLTCDGITDHTVFGSNSKLNYTYDYRNRLATVADDSGNLVATYTYDATNRRVRKQTWTDDDPQVVDADTWFLWDGWQAIEERADPTDGNTVSRRYVYGATYIDDHVVMLTPDGQGGWTILYSLQDRMQHVVALADSTGSVVERYAYSPYGTLVITDETGQTDRTSAGSSYGNCYSYTGRYWDADAGLYYYRNRWYTPDLGRFTTRDPAGYVDGASLYTYAGSLPTAYGDPSGAICFGLGVTIEVSAPPIPIDVPVPPVALPRVTPIPLPAEILVPPVSPAIPIPAEELQPAPPLPDELEAEHTKGARKSTADKHQKGKDRASQKSRDKKRQKDDWKSHKEVTGDASDESWERKVPAGTDSNAATGSGTTGATVETPTAAGRSQEELEKEAYEKAQQEQKEYEAAQKKYEEEKKKYEEEKEKYEEEKDRRIEQFLEEWNKLSDEEKIIRALQWQLNGELPWELKEIERRQRYMPMGGRLPMGGRC